jgi:hypothetical protein
MRIDLPDLEERVFLNGDGEGQTFGRDARGRVVVISGNGDYSNGGWWDCYSQVWDIVGDWYHCLLLPIP